MNDDGLYLLRRCEETGMVPYGEEVSDCNCPACREHKAAVERELWEAEAIETD